MSTKATTLNSKKSVGALVKDWMSLVGIAILIVVFSIISYVKFGAQYFLTWSKTFFCKALPSPSLPLASRSCC